jgi:hypothetical protein
MTPSGRDVSRPYRRVEKGAKDSARPVCRSGAIALRFEAFQHSHVTLQVGMLYLLLQLDAAFHVLDSPVQVAKLMVDHANIEAGRCFTAAVAHRAAQGLRVTHIS